MPEKESRLFDDNLYVLKPGEYYATSSESILGTVTGSSVVVCMYDRDRGIGGMCHFIIPGAIGTKGLVEDDIARFGVSNMEYLMGEIVKLGGDRKHLKAKVYGSSAISPGDQRRNEIIKGNLQFVEQYFALEKIEIEDEDQGGNMRKKICFNPQTGEVKKEDIGNEEAALFVRLESEYIDSVFRDKDKTGDVRIF